jgi:hypothetical protein
MESIYKVGDEVLVKSKLDDNCEAYDYPFTFVEYMLRIYGGKICKIKKVFPTEYFKYRKLYEEPYGYFIDGSGFRWSSAMFEKEF